MDAFVHTGDFDFNVFTQLPGPKYEQPPKAEKKRKERDSRPPIPTWQMRNRKQEEYDNSHTDTKKETVWDDPYFSDPYGVGAKQQEPTQPPPAKKQNVGKASKKDTTEQENENVEQQEHNKFNNKKFTNTNNSKDTPNKDKPSRHNKPNLEDNKGRPEKPLTEKQKQALLESVPKMSTVNWNYNTKEAWEPEEADYANMIKIDKADSLFLGDFDETGLANRVISLLTKHMNFKQPTLIQHYAIPQIIKGHDVLVKAETGSGKTLTYVLPMLNVLGDITPKINREQGAYAIILAPTRELVSQIYDVVCQVAKTWIWVVPSYLSGGENKSTEKTRLRKGVNVLVATPGRLMDHLQTTSSFKYDKLRFLILDEADRLLDMGLGPQIADIVGLLRKKCEERAQKEHRHFPPAGTHPNKPAEEKPKLNTSIKFEYDEAPKEDPMEGKLFQTVMASATLHNGIRTLAYIALQKPVYIGLLPQAIADYKKLAKQAFVESGQNYDTPTQLKQYYTSVRTKDRPSSLIYFLQERVRDKNKVVVFVASCASVDFFHNLLTGANGDEASLAPKLRKGQVTQAEMKESEHVQIVDAPIYKLHGELSQVERSNNTLKFRKDAASVLIATDVAARGLDFPDVDWIVQFDPPADTKDYIHRVGRTARMGKKGKSLLYITPEESEYLNFLKGFGIALESIKIPGDLTIQHLIESYVRQNRNAYSLARHAYVSAVRAYATHSSATKHIFNVANLHVGHLAKSFCLRDRPSDLAASYKSNEEAKEKEKNEHKKTKKIQKSYESAPKRMATTEFEAGF